MIRYKIIVAFVMGTGLLLMSFQTQLPVYTVFSNPSFEHSVKKEGLFPKGWSSTTPDNTPDILPGGWGVQHMAHEGQTCVGLVTRETGSTEDLGQYLALPLHPNDCYTFSIYLSHAKAYVGYNQPVRLRVWGGQKPGQKQVLLGTSPLIAHTDWKLYHFQFEVKQRLPCITLEASFGPGTTFKYRGNILLDACSAVWKCEKA
jgi:hypothetical protein